MSLSVWISATIETSVFDNNITHNLAKMASEAGLYEALWRPDDLEIKTAGELIPLLTDGLVKMKYDRERLIKLEPENKWGTYDGLLKFVEEYLEACKKFPQGTVGVSR